MESPKLFPIKRGVRQGCVGSPDLYNLYRGIILRALEDIEEGIVVNGVRINNLRYADDTVLLATSEEGLQKLFDVIVPESEHYGLTVNSKKTKCMVISKLTPEPQCDLIQETTTIEQVSSFSYLGSLITHDGRCRPEIRRRIVLAKNAFGELKPILRDRKLSIDLKVRLLKCYVWSTLLYGCESWTITAETKRNIDAVEMWFYRRMLRISYMDRITNVEVLRRVHQDRRLFRTILDRQHKFMGHCIRKAELEDLCLAGRMIGKRARGGQRKTYMKNFKEYLDADNNHPRKIWDNARDRSSWVRLGPLRA